VRRTSRRPATEIPFDMLDGFYTRNSASPSSDAVGELAGFTS
jgi:hypothetical protein